MTKANPFRFSTQYQDDETDLLMYPNRPYSASQGRFLRKDSLQEQGGMNVYAFVANNPLSSIDILGLWNANVHNIMTRDWARANHYPPDAAKAIGNADNAVDGGVLGVGKGWGPWGDQSYHFNRSLGGGDDSRLRHNTEHLAKAEAACNMATDDPKEAAYQLGTALHPLQDWVAHGDYFIKWEGPVTSVHNAFTLQNYIPLGIGATDAPDDVKLDAVGGPDGTPAPDGRPAGAAVQYYRLAGPVTRRGDPPAQGMLVDYAIYKVGGLRLAKTEVLTVGNLKSFRDYVEANGGCKCKHYFGIQ